MIVIKCASRYFPAPVRATTGAGTCAAVGARGRGHLVFLVDGRGCRGGLVPSSVFIRNAASSFRCARGQLDPIVPVSRAMSAMVYPTVSVSRAMSAMVDEEPLVVARQNKLSNGSALILSAGRVS